MNTREQIELLLPGVGGWNERRKRHDFTPALAGVDLRAEFQKERRRKNESEMLRPINLAGVNFNGGNLSKVVFGDARLNGAHLRKANLSGAYLYGADLAKADLAHADLSGADLAYANLSGADLTQANLTDADLSGIDFRGVDISSATLRGATLTGALPVQMLLRSDKSPDRFPGAVDYTRIITIEPDKGSGKPCIKGMRITVGDVLQYFASGMSEAEILSDFPYLTREDILACFAFAADLERRTFPDPTTP